MRPKGAFRVPNVNPGADNLAFPEKWSQSKSALAVSLGVCRPLKTGELSHWRDIYLKLHSMFH